MADGLCMVSWVSGVYGFMEHRLGAENAVEDLDVMITILQMLRDVACLQLLASDSSATADLPALSRLIILTVIPAFGGSRKSQAYSKSSVAVLSQVVAIPYFLVGVWSLTGSSSVYRNNPDLPSVQSQKKGLESRQWLQL